MRIQSREGGYHGRDQGSLVRRLIEKITVYDEKLTVEFKSGLEIDVDA